MGCQNCSYLRKLTAARQLHLKDLTLKTTMLLALLTAQRQQTLRCLNVEDMHITKNKFVFQVTSLLKTSKPGQVGTTLELHAYPPDRRLCVYTYLTEYLRRTCGCRGKEKQLLISFRKPFARVSIDTIARWLRIVMERAGLDVNHLKPHSTHSAATSGAQQASVPVTEILSQAGWQNEQTFQRFYNKPLIQTSKTFMESLLKD